MLNHLLNGNAHPHMCSQHCELPSTTANIGSVVWGTPANFNGFCALASLLQRHRSTEANQTLHDVLPSPGLVHYIYIFGGSCPVREFCQVQHSLCVQALRSPISSALLHSPRVVASAKLCGIQQRAPPIFGREAITLGIGPHSSSIFFFNGVTATSQ